jgi:hypothetical protein
LPNAEDQRKPSGLRRRRSRLRDPVGHHSVSTVGSTDAADSEMAMIAERFDSRTLANMEAALERACNMLAIGAEGHAVRRHIASKILECAEGGDRTLEA